VSGCVCPDLPHYSFEELVYAGQDAHLRVPLEVLVELPARPTFVLAVRDTVSEGLESTGLPRSASTQRTPIAHSIASIRDSHAPDRRRIPAETLLTRLRSIVSTSKQGL